jgi:hypothetical protein
MLSSYTTRKWCARTFTMAWASSCSKRKKLRRSWSLAPCDTIRCQNVGKPADRGRDRDMRVGA